MFKSTPLTGDRAGTWTQILCLSIPEHSLLSHDQLTYSHWKVREIWKGWGSGRDVFLELIIVSQEKCRGISENQAAWEDQGFVIVSLDKPKQGSLNMFRSKAEGLLVKFSSGNGEVELKQCQRFAFSGLCEASLCLSLPEIPLYTRFLANVLLLCCIKAKRESNL